MRCHWRVHNSQLSYNIVVNKFPNNFIWGAATAAYQIEGHPDEAKRGLSDWSRWKAVMKPTGKGLAVKHIEHLDEDIALIKNLNLGAYRFSFNWATLHRGPGVFDKEAIAFYKTLLAKLMPVKAFATIVHFTLPHWLAKRGGWEDPETAREYANYTQMLVDEFGDYISHWITLNEPNIFLWFGYESGIWPPGYKNAWDRYLTAFQGMLTGHKLAYELIKAQYPHTPVGFAQNLYHFEAEDELGAIGKYLRSQIHNYAFIEAAAEMGALDFLGVNYYTRFKYKFNPEAYDSANTKLRSKVWAELMPPELETNDLGWEINPEGLYKVLTAPKLKWILGDRPIYITENGYSCLEDKKHPGIHLKNSKSREALLDIEDSYRVDFIRQHLKACHRAIVDGVKLEGYFYWSLLDNFEWALGMEPRFGLVHVDQQSYKRSEKDSYKYYADIAKTNIVN